MIVYTRDCSQEHNHSPFKDIRIHVAHRQRAAQKVSISQLSSRKALAVQKKAEKSTSNFLTQFCVRMRTIWLSQRT
ncbi:hypothetical protein GQ600_4213 [Phytophthora cactorum]|nr:hypothetical protein GQ600_4213 [Phytophthora cactorum]